MAGEDVGQDAGEDRFSERTTAIVQEHREHRHATISHALPRTHSFPFQFDKSVCRSYCALGTILENYTFPVMAFSKLVRYEADGFAHYGDLQQIIDDEYVVQPLSGSPFESLQPTEERTIRVKKVSRFRSKSLRIAQKLKSSHELNLATKSD